MICSRARAGEVLEQLAALLTQLKSLARVQDVRGMGLMWGIELTEPAAPYVSRLYDDGLLVTSAGENVIRLLPPLVVSAQDIWTAVQKIAQVLQ